MRGEAQASRPRLALSETTRPGSRRNEVFEVYPLLFRGSVVDILVTHLLRPGPVAALAAVELVLARRVAGDFDLPYAEQWAARVGRVERMQKALTRADELEAS